MALKKGSQVFLRFDSPSRGRLLQLGTVREVRDSGWKLAFEERHRAVETGQEKLVYYYLGRKFFQQLVLVEAQSISGPPYTLTLKYVGDAIPEETRQEDRISTVGTDLTATLEDEGGCPVHDVSLSGLAAVATQKYPVGRCVDIAIPFEDEEYVGQVEIRCANPLDCGKTRYGMLGVFDTAEGRNLQNGLTRMTLEIQQQHLRHISGSD